MDYALISRPAVKGESLEGKMVWVIEPEEEALFRAAPDLLNACKAMIAKLENLTSDEFAKGGEKVERERMIAAIAEAEKED